MKKLLFIILLFCASNCYAATYYVNGSAANDSGDGSSGSPKKYIKSGIGLMSGGDTLIIKDGTYTGGDNMIDKNGDTGSPWDLTAISGASDAAPTIIKAENYLGVVIDAADFSRNPVFVSINYAKFENLHFKRGLHNVRIKNSSHVKIINCASEESSGMHFDLVNTTTYSLVEDCFAWGMGTYYFVDMNYGHTPGNENGKNVFRRCVARRDAHYYQDGGNHYGSFVTYQTSDYTIFQNCISIDGEVHRGGAATDPQQTVVFFTANGAAHYEAYGCIALNDVGQVGGFESSANPVILNNCSVYMNTGTSTFGVLNYGGVTVVNSIIAGVRGDDDWMGIALGQVGGAFTSVKNNIIADNNLGMQSVSNHTYNNLYWNTANYSGCSQATGEDIEHDPLSSGLLYLTRIEDGSWLKTAGESGGQMGPTILYQIGTSGTLYGDAGWNTTTETPLWPFPNEDTIRTKMRTYSLHSADGTRGFCAVGQTLTTYIWEYLGNDIPEDIYGEEETGNTTPAKCFGGKVRLGGNIR